MLNTVINPTILFLSNSNFRLVFQEKCPVPARECKFCWRRSSIAPFTVNERQRQLIAPEMTKTNTDIMNPFSKT